MSDNPITAAAPAPAASEAAPAIPAAPVQTPTPATPPTSVVAETPAPVDPPAADAAPAPEAPAAEAAPAEAEATPQPEAAAAPVYTEFKIPDGFKIAPEQLAEATRVLGKYGVPQEAAQELVDLHAAGLQAAVEHYSKTATDFWNDRAQKWVTEAKADPTFGENLFQTSLGLARGVWNEVLPNKADRERLYADLTDTKIGDHPLLFRAMAELGRRMQQVYAATGTTTWAAVMKKLREPAAPPPGTPARAPGAAGRAADRRYQPRH